MQAVDVREAELAETRESLSAGWLRAAPAIEGDGVAHVQLALLQGAAEGDGVEAAARLQHRSMEQPRSRRTQQLHARAGTARTLPTHRHPLRVPIEVADVIMHPPQRRRLVLYPLVARRREPVRRVLRRQVALGEEAKQAEAVVDGHIHEGLGVGHEAAGVQDVTPRERAAVDVHVHGEAARRLGRGVGGGGHGQVQAVLGALQPARTVGGVAAVVRLAGEAGERMGGGPAEGADGGECEGEVPPLAGVAVGVGVGEAGDVAEGSGGEDGEEGGCGGRGGGGEGGGGRDEEGEEQEEGGEEHGKAELGQGGRDHGGRSGSGSSAQDGCSSRTAAVSAGRAGDDVGVTTALCHAVCGRAPGGHDWAVSTLCSAAAAVGGRGLSSVQPSSEHRRSVSGCQCGS